MKESIITYKFYDITQNNIHEFIKNIEGIDQGIIKSLELSNYIDKIKKYIYDREDYNDGTVSIEHKIRQINIKTSEDCKKIDDFSEVKNIIEKCFNDNDIIINTYLIYQHYDFSDSGIVPHKNEFIEFIQDGEIKITLELEFIRCKEDSRWTCKNYEIIIPIVYIL